MTEAEWLKCEDVMAMARFVDGHSCDTARRWQLFTLACCRRLLHQIWEHPFRMLIDVLDRYIKGRASPEEWQAALLAHYTHEFHSAAEAEHGIGFPIDDVRDAAEFALMNAEVLASRCDSGESQKEAAAQAHFIRDMFNPFASPAAIDPAWRTWNDATIVKLAQRMYDARDFTAMPILADALEEAGCTSGELLDHCRQAGEHVRGCWVVDLVLGKE